jgi:hypothetical protein
VAGLLYLAGRAHAGRGHEPNLDPFEFDEGLVWRDRGGMGWSGAKGGGARGHQASLVRRHGSLIDIGENPASHQRSRQVVEIVHVVAQAGIIGPYEAGRSFIPDATKHLAARG